MFDRMRSYQAGPWSHNLHYHRVILDAIPLRCERALDVGCRQGALARRMREVVPQITGIDRDERSIAIARSHPGSAGIDYILGDFLSTSFELESLDLVTIVAALHHMDAESALRRMSDLLRPGGVLAVVGLARDRAPARFCLTAAALPCHWLHRAIGALSSRSAAVHQSPVIWPAPLSYQHMRLVAARALPGARCRRRLYWRYTLVWVKPS